MAINDISQYFTLDNGTQIANDNTFASLAANTRIKNKNSGSTFIKNSNYSNVFERKFVYDYKGILDVNRMREAAKLLEGKHDFKSFCGNKRMKKSTVRTIYEIKIEELPGELKISYTGNGFLMNMVRILTGTLIEVGDGRRTPESMTDILEGLDRELAGYTAPPQGLMLEQVYYE